MAIYIFNGAPPSSIKQKFVDAYKIKANVKLRLIIETTSSYKKSGIYSATRDDTSKPIVIDWGDGTVEQVNGNVSQKIHTYSSVGTFDVVIENIKSYAASTNNVTWSITTSQNYYTLKEVVAMPDSVTSVGNYAFYYCALTSMMIPDTVTSIGIGTFLACSELKSVHISDLAKWCGVSFSEQTSNPLNYAHKLYLNGSLVEDLTIPDSVTSIGSYAFYNCSGLTSVTIPDSVTSIGFYAFFGCSGLTTVTIPDSVTSIGDYVFYGCSGLTSVTIPNGVTSIGGSAFSDCSGLTSVTIPDSVTSIENEAFSNCKMLTHIIVNGKTITQIQAMNPLSWFESFGIPSRSVTITGTDGSFTLTISCFLKGTNILLADNTTKKIEDLTYDDVLKVWDFDEGQLGSAKVCWLTRPGLKSNHYYQLTFDNGTVLKTTGINSNHRVFSVDQSKFTNVADAKVGDKVFSIDGTLTITDVKYVEEECEYYNVMTSGKINCFANGILTSDRYGNLYPIVDMKYVKDERTIRPYSEYEAVGIDRYWYDNLRLGENTETVEKSKEYVWKCLGQMLPLPEQQN